MKKFISLIGWFAVLSLAAFSASAGEKPALIEFVRPLGMGGAFTAVADDHNVFNYNPAGMVQRTGAQITILEIAPGVSKDTMDAYDFISDNENDLTNWDDLTPARQQELTNKIANDITKLDPRVYIAADIASYVSGPNFLGSSAHVGFGSFGVVDSRFKLDPGVLVPNISYEINNDIVIPIAIAKRWDAPFVPGRIGVGVTGKYIRRFQVKEDRLSVLQLEDIETPPITDGHGIGADLGFLYQPTDRFNVGLMVQDFLGTKMSFDLTPAEKGYEAQPARDSVIRPRTNVGVAVTPQSLLWILPTHDRWVFAADIRDILNKDDHLFFEDGLRKPFGENLYTHVHLGAEFRYWFMRFRGGAYQGYPSFGLGVDIPVLKIDYAFYSRELGRIAGDRREENHIVSLALRFGSGKTESRERIQKVKETRRQRNTATPDVEMAPMTPAEPVGAEPMEPSGEEVAPEMPQ